MPSVFISYSHSDRDFARRLAADLKNSGIKVWVDEGEIRIGDSLFDKLELGLLNSDYVAIILSPESVSSRWVRVELNAALHMEISKGQVKVLPILYRYCDIPPFLLSKVHVNFTNVESYFESLSQLLRLFSKASPPVWLSGKEAARLVRTKDSPSGSLIGLSQQGILQQYILHASVVDAQQDFLVADTKTGRSRIWVAEFYDESSSKYSAFGVHDGETESLSSGHLHNAPPLLDFNFIDSDVAVSIARRAALSVGGISERVDGMFITSRLSYWGEVKDYVWSFSFMDIALGTLTCGVTISARHGDVLYKKPSPR